MGYEAGFIHKSSSLSNNSTVACVVKYYYNYFRSAVLYDYKGFRVENNQCRCDSLSYLRCAFSLYKTMVYGYLTKDGCVVPYTKCANIPYEKIVPQFDSSLTVTCPC